MSRRRIGRFVATAARGFASAHVALDEETTRGDGRVFLVKATNEWATRRTGVYAPLHLPLPLMQPLEVRTRVRVQPD